MHVFNIFRNGILTARSGRVPTPDGRVEHVDSCSLCLTRIYFRSYSTASGHVSDIYLPLT